MNGERCQRGPEIHVHDNNRHKNLASKTELSIYLMHKIHLAVIHKSRLTQINSGECHRSQRHLQHLGSCLLLNKSFLARPALPAVESRQPLNK